MKIQTWWELLQHLCPFVERRQKNQTFCPQIPARSSQTGEELCFKGLLVPKEENPVQMKKMLRYRGDWSWKATSARQRHEMALRKMFATVRQALGPQSKGQYRHVPVRKPKARTSSTTFWEPPLFSHHLRGIHITCILPDVQSTVHKLIPCRILKTLIKNTKYQVQTT